MLVANINFISLLTKLCGLSKLRFIHFKLITPIALLILNKTDGADSTNLWERGGTYKEILLHKENGDTRMICNSYLPWNRPSSPSNYAYIIMECLLYLNISAVVQAGM